MPWARLPEGSVEVLDLSLTKLLAISEKDIQEVAEAARKEVEFRKSLYRGGRPLPELAGKTVILVDDGIATGCSILAAIGAIRRRRATRVVVAVPVAPASGCSAIRMEADEVISVEEPELFLAVSPWYRDFTQVSDEDVQKLLQNAESPVPRAA